MTSVNRRLLQVWDLKDLGLQAVQRVSSSSDPLRLLMEVSQVFLVKFQYNCLD